MGLVYYWKRMRKSWSFSFRSRRVTFGFWLNIVMDKVAEQGSGSNGDNEMIYQYRPLENSKHIRILELAPGRLTDPLRGRLIHNPSLPTIEGDNVPDWSIKYEALSYVWGALPSEYSALRIVLDEVYFLPIMPSLDAALRQLRSPDIARTIWADSICINQGDNDEKGTQVQQMLEIYARAQVVNIWLGPAQGDSPMGMTVLKYLAQSTLDHPAPWIHTPEVDFLPGLREVFRRGWFNRIWVVQEAAVSQKAVMICGQDSFQWTNDPVNLRKFIRRMKYAAISPQWEQAGLSEVNLGMFLQVLNLQMQHIERHSNQILIPPPDILDVAHEMRHRKAFDRRDMLFAIMGLTNKGKGSAFSPDYSMNVEMVFQQLLESIEI